MRGDRKDARALAPLVKKLWPEHSENELIRILQEYADGEESCIFVCKKEDHFMGVALCCLRHDYVEGCETSPVGYLEGIYVDDHHRMQGIARKLVHECENWAREKGCRELASDCELSNTASRSFHLGTGFSEENRIICFKKNL